MSIINDVFKSIDTHKESLAKERQAIPINFATKPPKKVPTTALLLIGGAALTLGLMIWGIYSLKSRVSHKNNQTAHLNNKTTAAQKGGQVMTFSADTSKSPDEKRVLITNSQIARPLSSKKTAAQSMAEVNIQKEVINALEHKEINQLLKLMAKNNEPKAFYLSLIDQLLKNANWYLPEAKPELLKQALLFYPKETKLRLQLAEHYFSLKKHHLVVKTLLSHTPKVQENSHYYKLLAVTYVHLQQYKQALPIYRSLVELLPIEPSYLLGLGLCYQMLDDEPKAREAYIQARKYAKPTWSSRAFVDLQLNQMQG